MKSLKVILLIAVACGLLKLAYGMEMVEPRYDPSEDARLRITDLFSSAYGAVPRGGGAILVIPTAQADEIATTRLVTTATEDLSIMCRVFDKELRLGVAGSPFELLLYNAQYHQNQPLSWGSERRGRNASCMYLEGHAAVFLMSVDFPLTPGPEDTNVRAEPNEPADMIWHQARQELYGTPEKSKEKDSAKKYDPQRLEGFKTSLLKTFKHAANIECLRADEWVIAVVWGPGSGSGKPKSLVVRAKKSDVTGLSADTLTLEEFRDQVSILIVPGGPRPWSP
ncbi:MAG: hypothetical protein ACYS8Z_11520 [Planctomycetota bacterium]|jgi:hypothetical protein